MADDHSLQVDSTRIHYECHGSGPPLVLLHGLSGSSRWWKYNIPVLAEHHRVYVVDLIGFGRSRGQRFVLRKAAQALVQWMDRLDMENAHVIGHSMGGWIATDLTTAHPERVRRLVLVDAASLPLERSYVRHGLGLVQALFESRVNFLPVLVQDALRAGPLNILKAAYELLTSDISHKVHQIQVPTLVVWGERDWLVPLRIGEQLQTHLPNAQLCVIPRAGHNPMWDRPAAFNDLILRFLLSTEAAVPGAEWEVFDE